MRYLDDDAGAVNVQLGDDDLRAIDEALPAGATAGDRYAAAGMAGLNL